MTACEWKHAGVSMVIAETALWEERNADKAGPRRAVLESQLLVRNDRNPKSAYLHPYNIQSGDFLKILL